MHRATNLSYSVGQPISILSHYHRTLPSRTAHLQERSLSGGSKAGIRRVSRTDFDLPIRTSIKIIWILNNNLTSHGNLFPGSNLERAATLVSPCFYENVSSNARSYSNKWWPNGAITSQKFYRDVLAKCMKVVAGNQHLFFIINVRASIIFAPPL